MKRFTLHGTFINVFSTGTLMMGPAGIGKSLIALDLIDRGHQLIADDIVECEQENQKLIGKCPLVLQDFLETRCLGILNIRKLYHDKAITKQKSIDLIIELTKHPTIEFNRNSNPFYQKDLSGFFIPALTLCALHSQNIGLQIETAVKNFNLQTQGYFAHQTLINHCEQVLQ